MIAASENLPSTSCSAIAASSIQGTGAQSLRSALRSGRGVVSGVAFGPTTFSRLAASSLVRPQGRMRGGSAADTDILPLTGASGLDLTGLYAASFKRALPYRMRRHYPISNYGFPACLAQIRRFIACAR